MNGITVRDYARKEGITLGTAYRRLWEGQINATKLLGRWVIVSAEAITEDAGSCCADLKSARQAGAVTPRARGDVHYERQENERQG